ncbi:MAG: hypothetical protein J0J01_23265 [Reyranella sp.]|uniref:hypothetical protein n=1 Tax=Reyranella sp. TaxID=1929291 RepID=UPI001AC93203|nr:hypothetical protein [Reyranella sp.]MBN9089843.1 hypothetical protein [Reyranella sp.]
MTAAALAFGLGVSLLALAVPRSITATTIASGPAGLSALLSGQRIALGELQESRDTLQKALRWDRPARYVANLSVVELELALAYPDDSPQHATWLTQAEERTIEALKANPADGRSWLRLAIIRSFRQAPSRDIVAPLMTSLDMSPNDHSLWRQRIGLLMYYWGDFSPDEVDIMRHQVRTMWDDPRFRIVLLDAAMRYRVIGRLVGALTPDWEAIKELEAMQRAVAGP